ncbi:hypothetical protein F5984_10200 [Rudanella paleaurantiibacter]|uniref:Uncharacterized protein n=1 Tax=Rudanella paleaurantiibacter TaxID=2614655 RepID=A0A7J5U0G6_9BACT|nr:hypothetical protein [Rudanella paleaurantiibacter]KAB7731169.1 hypothetical protein F5984_10200 [Rudanella paleaurantiibacter]
MQRRLFLRQLSAGFAIPLLPLSSVLASSVTSSAQSALTSESTRNAATQIRNGQLGTVQSIQIIHGYNPAYTPPQALRQIAAQQLELTGQLLGHGQPIANSAAFFDATPSSAFGTYSGKLMVSDIQLTWQALARLNAVDDKVTSTLLIAGSKAQLSLDLKTHAFTIARYTY